MLTILSLDCAPAGLVPPPVGPPVPGGAGGPPDFAGTLAGLMTGAAPPALAPPPAAPLRQALAGAGTVLPPGRPAEVVFGTDKTEPAAPPTDAVPDEPKADPALAWLVVPAPAGPTARGADGPAPDERAATPEDPSQPVPDARALPLLGQAAAVVVAGTARASLRAPSAESRDTLSATRGPVPAPNGVAGPRADEPAPPGALPVPLAPAKGVGATPLLPDVARAVGQAVAAGGGLILPTAREAPATPPKKPDAPAVTAAAPAPPAPVASIRPEPGVPPTEPAVAARAMTAGPTASDEPAPAAVPVRLDGAFPAGPAPTPLAPAPVQPAVEPGIDPTRDAGLNRIIDRIALLRDAAADDLNARDTRIRLVPDALGPVEISVKREGQGVHVHFTASEAATRQLIADAQPRLAELAEQRGVRLERATVDAGASGQGGEAGQPRPQHQQPATPARPAGARPAEPEIHDERIA